jgi:hypothetical protein
MGKENGDGMDKWKGWERNAVEWREGGENYDTENGREERVQGIKIRQKTFSAGSQRVSYTSNNTALSVL